VAQPAATESQVRSLWDRLAGLPGGRRLFSLLLGRLAPYTGSIAPRVRELRTGYARVEMRDRRAVRNHLNSVHAIALMNLAEVSSGLALTYGLPAGARAILTGLSIEYLKKARGTLVAEAELEVPATSERREYEFPSTIRDAGGEVVARAQARWLVGPAE
jgi:acyl-coenzyme A thioesterase PaaI-like protein